MDFVLKIGDEEFIFTQFNDMVQQLAQWNNFDGLTPILLYKQPSETPTVGISTGETVETVDVFGGIPERYTEEQKEIYAKLKKAQDVFNQGE